MENAKPIEIISWLYGQEKDKRFDIVEHREKRTLNANSYCWVMLGRIADEIGSTKEEIYRDYIKNKGVYRVITMSSKAVPTFKKVWEKQGLGWLCEVSSTNIDDLSDVIAYYGTSSYNTKQMSNFIDYIVQECRGLGIETKRQEEIQSLLDSWK